MVYFRLAMNEPAPLHAGSRYDASTLCGSPSAHRTASASCVTCPDCLTRRERLASIARYRCDHDLCIAVLRANAYRAGREWMSL